MFLNLKDENSGRVVESDGRVMPNVEFDGCNGGLDNTAATEKPFMSCSWLSVVYSTQFSVWIRERKDSMHTLRMLDGRRAVTLRGVLGKGKSATDG